MMKKALWNMVPALILFGGVEAAAASPWQVSEVSGNVQLTENGRSRNAVRGALLASGAVIRTAPGSRAVIVRGQEFVIISPSTQLRVPEASSSNRIVQLIEDFGSAIFRIEKKSTPHFGVQTPYLAAVVKGTTFTVTVGPEGGKVKVTEGVVEVSTKDGGVSDLVAAGGSASVGKNDLYTLSVQGREPKELRSAKAPLAGGVTVNPNANPAAALKGDNRSARAQEVRIAKAIREEGVSLSKATRGMLEGRSAAEDAQGEFNEHSRQAIKADKLDKDKPAKNENKPDKNEAPGKEEKPGSGKPEQPKGDEGGKPGGPGGNEGNGDKPAPGEDKPAGEGKPGKDDGDKPVEEEGAKPGKDDGAKPGKDEDTGKPGKGDGAKPGKDDEDGGKAPGDDGDEGDDD